MHFSVYAAQAQGARKRQEDRTAVETTKEMTVAVLADGMGGMPMGAEAAEETVRTVTTFLGENLPGDPRQLLLDAATAADRNVTRLGTRFGFPGLCGSTLVCVLVSGDLIWWLSVGDSRIYLYKKGDLALLTTDHATVSTGALTSFIGGMSQVCMPAEPLKPEAGDMLLLASDGLWNTFSETAIAETLASARSDPAQALVQSVVAAENPFQDNVSTVVIHRES